MLFLSAAAACCACVQTGFLVLARRKLTAARSNSLLSFGGDDIEAE